MTTRLVLGIGRVRRLLRLGDRVLRHPPGRYGRMCHATAGCVSSVIGQIGSYRVMEGLLLGFGRIVALHHRSSALCQIHEEIRCLCL